MHRVCPDLAALPLRVVASGAAGESQTRAMVYAAPTHNDDDDQHHAAAAAAAAAAHVGGDDRDDDSHSHRWHCPLLQGPMGKPHLT